MILFMFMKVLWLQNKWYNGLKFATCEKIPEKVYKILVPVFWFSDSHTLYLLRLRKKPYFSDISIGNNKTHDWRILCGKRKEKSWTSSQGLWIFSQGTLFFFISIDWKKGKMAWENVLCEKTKGSEKKQDTYYKEYDVDLYLMPCFVDYNTKIMF